MEKILLTKMVNVLIQRHFNLNLPTQDFHDEIQVNLTLKSILNQYEFLLRRWSQSLPGYSPADDKNWKRTNHSEGYYLKTIGGTSSRFGITYGRWGKEDKVWNLKKGDAIDNPSSSSDKGTTENRTSRPRF